MLPEPKTSPAAPVGAIDKLTVISTDGASSLTKSVASTVASGLQLGTDLTGVDLSQLLARLANRTSDGSGRPLAPAPRTTIQTDNGATE